MDEPWDAGDEPIFEQPSKLHFESRLTRLTRCFRGRRQTENDPGLAWAGDASQSNLECDSSSALRYAELYVSSAFKAIASLEFFRLQSTQGIHPARYEVKLSIGPAAPDPGPT